jgi:hypothetical protein
MDYEVAMANFRAISSLCEALMRFLQANYNPEDFNNELEFKVYLAKDFSLPMAAGVSLFLYRIFHDGTHRTPSGRLGAQGRAKTQLPIDLHFLLTAWGKDASLQHTIMGWVMRVFEDNPVLPAGLLNAVAPEVFRPEETVEIVPAELPTMDMLRLWEGLLPHVYQLSVPYLARNLMIESSHVLVSGKPIQERRFGYHPTSL